MALLQYFRAIPGEHLPLPGQSLVSAKGLIFHETTVARNSNPRIITVVQPKRPPRKFSPAKNTRYTVTDLQISSVYCDIWSQIIVTVQFSTRPTPNKHSGISVPAWFPHCSPLPPCARSLPRSWLGSCRCWRTMHTLSTSQRCLW